MIDNTVIKVLSKEHGAKVIQWFKDQGVDTKDYEGLNKGQYYGIINGHFYVRSESELNEKVIKVIELPETKQRGVGSLIPNKVMDGQKLAQEIVEKECEREKAFREIKYEVLAAGNDGNNVNHPSHYGNGADDPYEVIKVIEAWDLNFHLSNSIKYIARSGKKDPNKEIEDLEKALWYLQREINNLKSKKTNK